ncbi:hypothetical protein SAMN05216474_1072 [Lishizhenia tianjinensis]|uniref:Uncharacterized protein n=1 Tax=Lishizhenia tianjinensis TaxID=477690 RepID=A0A1I6YPE8_9FLAO|nr:YeeE/YedE thiosulfate transporter family protein [Lishizhenia tianjinensis]SFT52406.1 hypothetical protein SAMN05216474_1072 [Lishizhenia tianjinensis]
MSWIYEPWPWYVAGPMITGVMLLLIYAGKSFGVSANLRSMCSIAGAGRWVDFFNFDWKKQSWNLLFIVGGAIGGFIAVNYLTPHESVAISESTQAALQELGVENPGSTFLPDKIFGAEALSSFEGWIFLIVGGLLIGFGTRYAGGCTSGHAISGLSNLQLPSLIAVVGFFIGGLIMTHLILPFIL